MACLFVIEELSTYDFHFALNVTAYKAVCDLPHAWSLVYLWEAEVTKVIHQQ